MNLAIAVGIPVLMGLFYSWTSRINGVFFFGRTVSPELRRSAEGRAITRTYLVSVAIATVFVSFCAWAAVHAGGRRYALLAALLECVAMVVIFAKANGRVRHLLQTHAEWSGSATAVREVGLLDRPSYWIPSVPAILLPLLISGSAFGAAVLAAAHGAGFASGWAAFNASIDGQGYSGILGLATGMMCAAVGTLVLFRTSARLRTRMAQYTVRACVSMEWVATALLSVTLLCNAYGVGITRAAMKGIIATALLIALAVMAANQARAKRFVPPPVEMGADDRWRWGLFYVDRNDPALFVQSRCGVGYTLNYGRVAAWPISLGLIAYFVGTLLLLPPHSH